MVQLRDYQEKAIQSLFEYLYNNKGKNPCLVCPTGGGKSWILAEFCRYSLTTWKDTRILVLTHQKELVEQDANAIKRLWSEADIGIYSAALNKRELDKPIIYGSIQSMYKLENLHFDVILIDEAHLVNNNETGMYRTFIKKVNPSFVIGFTATPYRLGQGLITESPSIFDDLIDVVSIKELQKQGYLAKLRSKATATHYDLSNVAIRGGDYVESDLQKATSAFATNEAICEEIVRSAKHFNRKHWLIFCTGIEHSITIAKILQTIGIEALYVSGDMSQKEREDILNKFTSGQATALCNYGILTTGFDYPNIDMIVLLRATLSTGLYMQMMGRGLRLKTEENKDCLVLDFAENVMRHGPITEIEYPTAKKGKGKKEGNAPCKECPNCLEVIPAMSMKCPECGYEFPPRTKLWRLYDGDVNGGESKLWIVESWLFDKTKSRKNGKGMWVISYYVERSLYSIKQFILFEHTGYAYSKSVKIMRTICEKRGLDFSDYYLGLNEEGKKLYDFDKAISDISKKGKPLYVITEKNGKFDNVTDLFWEDEVEEFRAQQQKIKELADETRKKLINS